MITASAEAALVWNSRLCRAPVILNPIDPHPRTSGVVVENVRTWLARRHVPPPAETWNGLGGRSRCKSAGRAQKNRLSQGNDQRTPDADSIRVFTAAVYTVSGSN